MELFAVLSVRRPLLHPTHTVSRFHEWPSNSVPGGGAPWAIENPETFLDPLHAPTFMGRGGDTWRGHPPPPAMLQI